MKNINNKGNSLEKMSKMKKRFLLLNAIIIIFSIIAFNFVSGADEFKPYLHGTSVGNVPKLETFGQYRTELFPGAGTFNYQIILPKGTNNLQPKLSINYNSLSALQRPGILGSGWTLSENSIMRNVNFTLDNVTDDYFILSFDSAKYRVYYNKTNFNAEIDPQNFKIENLTNAGQQYWQITTKDGTKYRFGFNNDSLLLSNTGRSYAVKWSLDLVQDTHNNSIFYNYLEDPFSGDQGAVYLSNITYNNDQLRKIIFSYESQSRPDNRLIYEQGNKLQEVRRLKDIYVYFNNSIVRR